MNHSNAASYWMRPSINLSQHCQFRQALAFQGLIRIHSMGKKMSCGFKHLCSLAASLTYAGNWWPCAKLGTFTDICHYSCLQFVLNVSRSGDITTRMVYHGLSRDLNPGLTFLSPTIYQLHCTRFYSLCIKLNERNQPVLISIETNISKLEVIVLIIIL